MLMEFTYYPYNNKFVDKVEERWGVYRLASSSKRILFIGRGNIKKHLLKHLPDGPSPAADVAFFSIEYYETGEEAATAWKEALEEYESKFGSPPLYNKKEE